MNHTVLHILIAVIMVAGIGGLVFIQKQNESQPAVSVEDTSSAEGLDVSAHSTRESCWTVINGGVYDLTSWIPQHPGGEQAILKLCGIDGSEIFNRKHGGAPRQTTILAGFKIGDVDENNND